MYATMSNFLQERGVRCNEKRVVFITYGVSYVICQEIYGVFLTFIGTCRGMCGGICHMTGGILVR